VQRFGQPDSRSFIAFVNGKYKLNESTDAYLFGSFGCRWGENDFNYRNPTQGGVFTSTQAADVFNQNFAKLPKQYQDWYNDNPAALSAYPGGFTPRFSATSLDGSAVAGVRRGRLGHPDERRHPSCEPNFALKGGVPLERPYESDGARYYGRLNFDF